MRSRRRSAQLARPGGLELLSTINELSRSVRRGFDAESAERIADISRQLLGARIVAIADDSTWSAQSGDEIAWRSIVEEHARAVLERGRFDEPTVYQCVLDGQPTDVSVAALRSGDIPIGTMHVVALANESIRLTELRDLAALVSSQLELAELEQSRAYAAEAELRALRAQISPHFLHNSLTAIAHLIMTDPVRARSLIAKFSEFLRASFRTQTDLTTVAEELRLVEAYLELEHVRFGDRFEVSLDIAPEVLPVRLPFLSIQPIVENAIRHGLEAKQGPGVLRIVALDEGPEVSISVDDDGVGIDADALEGALSGAGPTSHVGILAVDTRLRSTFGSEYGLSILTGHGAGTKATIRLPKCAPTEYA